MDLSDGFYFALTADQLKALRATKGDPGRRQFIEDLKTLDNKRWQLNVGDAWTFLQHLFDPENYPDMPSGHYLCHGRSLHKGQFSWIAVLPSENLPAIAAVLTRLDDRAFRSIFFEMNEERFRYRYVPFWVAEKWQREGRTTIVTEEQYANVWSALQLLRSFLPVASAESRQVVFASNFKAAPY
jgi:hypothetical protein